MIPTTPREMLLVLFWLFTTLAGIACVLMLGQARYASPMAAFFILGALFLGLSLCLTNAQPTPVDVWARQREVMAHSGQRQPMSPEINHGTVLYFALTLEEMGEAATTMGRFLLAKTAPTHIQWHHSQVVTALVALGGSLSAESRRIRDALKVITPVDLEYQLPLAQATALLDDLSDIMVTTAGMGLAAGMPVRAAYVEVQDSNDSKANPTTGLIDKTDDGKWIKGVNYREPDLARVLSEQYQECIRHDE